jgi:segregation and condensation protein B
LQLEQYENRAEAILFASGEPLPQKRLAAALEIEEDAAASVLESLAARYEKNDSAIELLRLDDCWQLCSRRNSRRIFAARWSSNAAYRSLRPLWRCGGYRIQSAGDKRICRTGARRGLFRVVATLCDKGLIEGGQGLDLPRGDRLPDDVVFLRCFG